MVLISTGQQSESVIHTHAYPLPFGLLISGHRSALSRIPYAISIKHLEERLGGFLFQQMTSWA